MKRSDLFWQTYLNLEKDVLELSRYIYFTDMLVENTKEGVIERPCNTQLEVFSPHIADLLIQCCVQIEAISKELYFENGGEKKRGDNSVLFDEDCLKLIDKKWNTHKKTVIITTPRFGFSKDENRILKPLNNAHKRQGTYWEKAYQAVKHDRFMSLRKGNIKALLHALAALFLLNVYYRNESWLVKMNEISTINYGMGSSIFSVCPPNDEQLWYGNQPKESRSPFVVKYREEDYEKIKETQNLEKQTFFEYLDKQPEMQEPEFVAIIQERKKSGDLTTTIHVLLELGKYRLNKSLPNHMSFEQRKQKLLNSEAWNSWIHQHNEHLTPELIDVDSIQGEIDRAGNHWGLEILKKLQKPEWITFATSVAICEVFIP